MGVYDSKFEENPLIEKLRELCRRLNPDCSAGA